MLEADAGGLTVEVEPSHQQALSSNSKMEFTNSNNGPETGSVLSLRRSQSQLTF
jgi:hypothetical protein